MARVALFEIQADDIERAKAFYGAALDWTFEDYSEITGVPYWGIVTGPDEEFGINGGLLSRPAATPGSEQGTNAYVCTVAVEDFDETAQKIVDAGGVVALPKMALKGVAWRGYFIDPEGNTFGIHQADVHAE